MINYPVTGRSSFFPFFRYFLLFPGRRVIISKFYFTIGEISKLYNIPAKTLRYYDSIGLFCPSRVNRENNYRYYSIEQFEMLNSIKYLRHMGFSIEDIKNHIKTRDSGSFRNKLLEYKEINAAEITRLKKANESLDKRISELDKALEGPEFGVIKISKQPERKILRLIEEYSDISGLELNLRKLENCAGIDPSIIIGRIGITVSRENLEKGIYSIYNSIFIIQDSHTANRYSETLPGGEYVTVSVNSGDHENSRIYYEKIFRFLKENSYRICGDSIERVIIDYFISADSSEHHSIIEIPVKYD